MFNSSISFIHREIQSKRREDAPIFNEKFRAAHRYKVRTLNGFNETKTISKTNKNK